MTRRSLLGITGGACCGLAWEPRWTVIHQVDGPIVDLVANGEAAFLASAAARLYRSGPGGWQTHELPDEPVGLAFSGESLWLAGKTGAWSSADNGKTWRSANKRKGIQRIGFRTEAHGYILGDEKTVLETRDAGKSWSPLSAAALPQTNAGHTIYHWIDFVTPNVGVIAGSSRPPRHGTTGPLPAWRDPSRGERRAEWPALSITLETRDGGETWKHSTTSLFGQITKVRYSKNARGLALVEFHDVFEYPSEVFSIQLRNGRSDRSFRAKDRAVTDFLIFPEGAVLGSIEPSDPPASEGTLRFFESTDLKDWRETSVQAPIPAGRVWLAGQSGDALWAATDTGSVLRGKLNASEVLSK